MNAHNDLLRACEPKPHWFVVVAGAVITIALCVLGAIAFVSVS